MLAGQTVDRGLQRIEIDLDVDAEVFTDTTNGVAEIVKGVIPIFSAI